MTVEIDRGTKVSNAVIQFFSRRGVSVFGARELIVRGRKSGAERRTPVNPLTVGGVTYLVAPRGHTQWVRNVRHDPRLELATGRRRTAYTAVEVHGAEAVPVLRDYLRRWAWEVGRFFPEGVTATSTDAELAAVVPDHPVFRLVQH